jgi:transcriptional regulator with XRE-family HTH domain
MSSEFSKNFKRIRIERGFTQETLAEAIDSTHATINRWENGKNKPDFEDFMRLTDALGVTPEVLSGKAPTAKSYEKTINLSEALATLANSTGIILKLPTGLEAIPSDVIKMAAQFENDQKTWDSVRGVLKQAQKSKTKTTKVSKHG